MIKKLSIFSTLFAILLLFSVTMFFTNVYAQETSEQNNDSNKDKIEEKKHRLEEKKKELQDKFNKKLQKLKDKYQDKINELSSDGSNSEKLKKLEERFHQSSEKVLQRLEEKSEKLNSRTQKLLEKINEGNYMGKKITLSDNPAKYELIFNSVSAYSVEDQIQTSTLIGGMNFTTFDSSKTNLKLELEECQILVGDIPYSCGFGKARTASFGKSGVNDSLVIIAFLEDSLDNEVHTTLKIFLQSDNPISQIGESEVEILGPQSKVSHLWFLNGTATLSKISPLDKISDEKNEEKTSQSILKKTFR